MSLSGIPTGCQTSQRERKRVKVGGRWNQSLIEFETFISSLSTTQLQGLVWPKGSCLCPKFVCSKSAEYRSWSKLENGLFLVHYRVRRLWQLETASVRQSSHHISLNHREGHWCTEKSEEIWFFRMHHYAPIHSIAFHFAAMICHSRWRRQSLSSSRWRLTISSRA